MKTLYPSEQFEGERFAEWLESQGYLFSHLAQSTRTSNWGSKMKNKRAGVKPGVPDYLICLKSRRLLFVELKKAKGGQVSLAQQSWLLQLNICGAKAVLARGAAEAIAAVEKEEQA